MTWWMMHQERLVRHAESLGWTVNQAIPGLVLCVRPHVDGEVQEEMEFYFHPEDSRFVRAHWTVRSEDGKAVNEPTLYDFDNALTWLD